MTDMRVVNEQHGAFLRQGVPLLGVIVSILCGGVAGAVLAVLIFG